jgi:hypothetical protein
VFEVVCVKLPNIFTSQNIQAAWWNVGIVPFRSDVILKNALQNVGQLIENDFFNKEKSNDIQMELVYKTKETFSQLYQDYFKKQIN